MKDVYGLLAHFQLVNETHLTINYVRNNFLRLSYENVSANRLYHYLQLACDVTLEFFWSLPHIGWYFVILI